MIVLDASVVVEWLAGGPGAERLLPWLEQHEGALHAPGLLDVEVAHVLRRLERQGAMSAPRGRAAIEMLGAFPVRRHPSRPLLPRIWKLRSDLTGYDAAYVALAEALGAPLLTLDLGLLGAPLACPVRTP